MTSTTHKTAVDPESLFREADHFEEKGDFKNAVNSYLAAARLGHHMSQLNLGNLYASGKGGKKNLERAAYWYKKAYKNGNSDGALNLAIDRRTAGNMRSAVVWFKKAIAMNSGEACIELAKIYNSRKGGRKAATNLLKQALRMNRDGISEAAKEEAESLLRALTRE